LEEISLTPLSHTVFQVGKQAHVKNRCNLLERWHLKGANSSIAHPGVNYTIFEYGARLNT